MSTQREIGVTEATVVTTGGFQIVARPPYGAPVDVTMFRGQPVEIGDISFDDPFGPKSLSLHLPQITYYDQLGHGDLAWLTKNTNVDVYWQGPLPTAYPFGTTTVSGYIPGWRWEGYIVSRDYDENGLTVQMKGALLQLDNFLARPEYVTRPLPYEWAIYRQFLNRASLRVLPPRIVFPSWWTQKYQPVAGTPSYAVPAGVTVGQSWTGLLTRSTGNWDPALTSYIQSLLAAMYTERGRWTLDMLPNRQPVLRHVDFKEIAGPDVAIVSAVNPGVKLSLSEDFDQSLTTAFGQGTGLNGITYSGMNVSADGDTTSYVPLAALRQVYPEQDDAGWFDRQVMAKEVMLQMQTGLAADDAAIVARAHLSRFADAGVTGQLVLSTDVTLGGEVLHRHLLRAGMDIQIPGLFGKPEGIVFHISSSLHSFTSGDTTLTIDSKRRDALTVQEVRARGRDSLSVARMIVAGQYQPPVPDQLYPWSYAEGSGYIPSNSAFSAVKLFAGMPNALQFPWASWTAAHPPSNPTWRNCYLRIGPTSRDATNNWFTQHTASGSGYGAPIRMSQAGSIRLLQIAAYDKNGQIKKVPFHVSFYTVGGVNPRSMPKIPADQVSLFPPYAAGQPYPFVRDGFEAYNADGTKTNPNVPQTTDSVGLIRAYGTFYEKAGYYPGSYSTGDQVTGLLVDEGTWSFDVTSVGDSVFDPYSKERNLTNPLAGQLYAMIYCDAQGADEVFFLGRIFRQEPGSGGV